MTIATASAPARCDANTTQVGITEWGTTGIPCQTRVGLRSFLDRSGVRRYYCPAPEHRRNVERRFGLEEQERVARVVTEASAPLNRYEYVPGCHDCDRRMANGGFGPAHLASPRCESGRHEHCSCDVCF